MGGTDHLFSYLKRNGILRTNPTYHYSIEVTVDQFERPFSKEILDEKFLAELLGSKCLCMFRVNRFLVSIILLPPSLIITAIKKS